MSDLISRESAVKTVIRKCSPICAWQVGTQQYPDCVVAEINALPSADRPHGEWKFVDNEIFAGEYFCSICGKRAEVDLYGEWILSNYCPSCGARIVKGGDDK